MGSLADRIGVTTPPKAPPMPDIHVVREGGSFVFQPLTHEGRSWLQANTDIDHDRVYAAGAYALKLLDGIFDDGLAVI